MSSSPPRRRRRAGGPMPPLPIWALVLLLAAVLFAIWYLNRLQ